MSIEFPCSQCGKLLRVGDDAAGKQARCPACSTVQSIPFQQPSSGEAYRAADLGEHPFAGHTGEVTSPPPPDPTNPYAAPLSILGLPPNYSSGEYWGPRNGPPWERDGASFNSFWATLKLAYSSPQVLFREMRREGGFSAPLLYSLAGAVVGGLPVICYNLGFQALMMQIVVNQPGMARGQIQPGLPLPIMAVLFIIFIPLGTVIQSFVGSGIFHLCLMLVGGARQQYETTYRVITYSYGSAAILGIIPFCGPYIQGILGLVFTGIGLAYAHETTGIKATLSVLLPVIVCCGAAIALYAVVIGLVIANAR